MSLNATKTGSGKRGEAGCSLAELILVISLTGMLATLVSTTFLAFSRAGISPRPTSTTSATFSPMETWK